MGMEGTKSLKLKSVPRKGCWVLVRGSVRLMVPQSTTGTAPGKDIVDAAAVEIGVGDW